jgi:transcriptional regulator with XRE-family HTH domain
MTAQPTTRLREARIRALLSKQALADKAGVDRSTVIRAEKGQPTSDVNQERLAQALEIPRTELFAEREEASA